MNAIDQNDHYLISPSPYLEQYEIRPGHYVVCALELFNCLMIPANDIWITGRSPISGSLMIFKLRLVFDHLTLEKETRSSLSRDYARSSSKPSF